MMFSGQSAVAIENAQLFEQAYYLSVTDPLTELINRSHFFEVARLEFERAHRYRRNLSVMMVGGDLALREIAARINKTVHTTDMVVRFGGEEFMVLMPETHLDEARQVAERVRHAVCDSPIENDSGLVLSTLSIEVSEINGKSIDLDQLIKYADRALYEATAAGRNRVVAQATPGTEAIRRVAETSPDLILMDIKIRGPMDGIETAKQIHTTYDIPVIYLTAFADETTIKRASLTEAFGYLLKPFEDRELPSAIEIALHKHTMENKLRASKERYALAVQAANEGTSEMYFASRWREMLG